MSGCGSTFTGFPTRDGTAASSRSMTAKLIVFPADIQVEKHDEVILNTIEPHVDRIPHITKQPNQEQRSKFHGNATEASRLRSYSASSLCFSAMLAKITISGWVLSIILFLQSDTNLEPDN